MSTVRVGENENLDSALRRFKRKSSRNSLILSIFYTPNTFFIYYKTFLS